MVAVVPGVATASALKASEGFSRVGPSAVTIVGYAVALVFLSLTLRTIPVGIVDAVRSGSGSSRPLVGWMVFRQSLDRPARIGPRPILAGVIGLDGFSNAASR